MGNVFVNPPLLPVVAAASAQPRLAPPPLPTPLTPHTGRAAECRMVHDALKASRLVTLTGVGGTGKTRLALQVAEEVAVDFRNGAAFVDLAPINDPSLLPMALARALRLAEQSATSTEEHLIEALHSAHLLLVVDNLEHLLEEAPLLARLLSAAPRLQILSTSRIPLRLYGEHEIRVPPLHLPEGEAETAASEAVQLFVQRARAVDPAFAAQGETLIAVGAVCTALDGLPLAIELAAARIKLFSPETLVPRLGERLAFLTGGPRDLPRRQQTLRAALDWSKASRCFGSWTMPGQSARSWPAWEMWRATRGMRGPLVAGTAKLCAASRTAPISDMWPFCSKKSRPRPPWTAMGDWRFSTLGRRAHYGKRSALLNHLPNRPAWLGYSCPCLLG